MRLADLLQDVVGLTVLHGKDALDRSFTKVFTTDLRDPSRYLEPGSLVLTGLMWRRDPTDSELFVRAVAGHGVAAVAAGEAALGSVPDDLVEACQRYDVALLGVPVDVSFASIADLVASRHDDERGRRMAHALNRQRQLWSAVAEGRSLDDLLSQVATETELDYRVLTPTGRVVAASDQRHLAATDLDLLSHAFLTAGRLPMTVELTGGAIKTIVAVESGLAQRIGSWFLVCDGQLDDVPEDLRSSVDELAAVVAVERQRTDERRRHDQRVADEIVAAMESGQPSHTELSVHLSDLGADPDACFVVTVAEMIGGSAELAAIALHEAALCVTANPVTALRQPASGEAAGEANSDTGSRAVALVAVPDAAPTAAEQLRTALERLRLGLGRARLVAGISEPVAVDALAGALGQATVAARVAAAHTGQMCVVTSDEVVSHVALLASVPDDVRRAFAARVLRPIVDHDERHRGDLLRTLEEFLRVDGSWQRCAGALHVHVNTVRYRIGRVEQLTGRDLSRLEDRVDVLLALRSWPRRPG